MKHKPHLLQKVMTKLRKVPMTHATHGEDANGMAEPSKHPTVSITIGGAAKPPLGEGHEDDPSLESPLMDEDEDDGEGINAPFGGFKRTPGHKYGK